MKNSFFAAVLFALESALFLTPGFQARGEQLVQAQLEGIVNVSPIPELNGQPWKLTIVFDRDAPEAPFSVPNPGLAEYFNNSSSKVVRLLDFSIGDSGSFTIHLVNPLPANEFEVRIDIDNNFGEKSFFTHVDDAALLPTWNGSQLDQFMLALNDNAPGGYSDGTDHLPGPDAAITIAEFSSFKQVRLQIGAGQLIGTPTSIVLTPVPEVSPSGLCAMGGLFVLLLSRRRG